MKEIKIIFENLNLCLTSKRRSAELHFMEKHTRIFVSKLATRNNFLEDEEIILGPRICIRA